MRHITRNIIIYVFAVIIFLYTVLPIFWIFITSFKSQNEIFQNTQSVFPIKWTLENYKKVLMQSIYGKYFLNSIIITFFSTTIVMCCAILSGYSFSMAFDYKWKNPFMIFIIIARMVPEIAIIIPMYFFIQKLGLYDTKTGIVLMISAMAYPLATWLIKSFFDDIPSSLYDAGKIDGCSFNHESSGA